MTVEWKGSNGREFYLDNQIKKNKWSIGAEVGVRFGRTLFYLLDNNPRLQMYAHSYKAVMKDLKAYAPKVKQKCGLLGHDIDYPSIQKALKDSSIDYEVGPDNVWQQKI